MLRRWERFFILSWTLTCLSALCQAASETTGKACYNSTDSLTVYRSGVDAKLFYNTSIRENVKDFRGYRAYAHSLMFASMSQYESEATCSGMSKEICLTGKIKFRKWNQTHLMIKIFNVTINDSGLYAVSASFRGLQEDKRRTKCLQVTHLEKIGPKSTPDYSTTTMKISRPQSPQVNIASTIKSSEPVVSMAPTRSGDKKHGDSTRIIVYVVIGTVLGILALVVMGIGINCVRRGKQQTLPCDSPLLEPEENVLMNATAMPNPQFSDQVRQDNASVPHSANLELVDQSSGHTPPQEQQSHQNERCTAAPYKIPRPVNSSVPSDSEEKIAQEFPHINFHSLENRSTDIDLIDQSSGCTPLLTTRQEQLSHQNERCTAAFHKIPRSANPSLLCYSKESVALEGLHNNLCSQDDNCVTASYKIPRNPNFLLPSIFKGESPYMTVQSSNDWEVPCENLKLFDKIGGGAFGQVWKGEAKDVGHTQGWSEVAVKMLKEKYSPSDSQDLRYELNLLKKLKPHPNVIQLLGCLTKDIFRYGKHEFRPPLIILEFLPHGNLLEYLKKRREETKDSPRKISTEQLCKFAYDIARGMAFISAQELVHRDLAARNILVGEGLSCKITDFGMTRHVGEAQIYIRKSKGVEPLRWMAVESLERQVFTTKSDVWSYGIVLYEIFTLGEEPYAGMKGAEVLKYVKDGRRLERTSRVNQEMYDMMLQCWDQAPSRRPTFESIATWLKTYTRH